MAGKREIHERDYDGGTELEVSEAYTWWDLIKEAVRSSGMYGGIAIGSVLVLTLFVGLSNVGKTTVERSWEQFTSGLAASVWMLLIYFVPLVVLISLIAFVAAAWRRRRLTTRYRIEVEGDEVRCIEKGAVRERPVLEESTETVLDFQSGPVADSNLEGSLSPDASHEVTVMTEEGMYTFGEGLSEEESERVVERLDRAVFE